MQLEGERYLFLWRTSDFTYADVRRLDSGVIKVIDSEAISSILRNRHPFTSQLRIDLADTVWSIPLGGRRARYQEGWPVQDEAGSVVAVGLAETE